MRNNTRRVDRVGETIYSSLGPLGRVREVIEAYSEGAEHEAQEIKALAPRGTFSAPEPRFHAILEAVWLLVRELKFVLRGVDRDLDLGLQLQNMAALRLQLRGAMEGPNQPEAPPDAEGGDATLKELRGVLRGAELAWRPVKILFHNGFVIPKLVTAHVHIEACERVLKSHLGIKPEKAVVAFSGEEDLKVLCRLQEEIEKLELDQPDEQVKGLIEKAVDHYLVLFESLLEEDTDE